MDWSGLTINVVAIFVGLGIYIGLSRTKWGREHTEYQYALMLLAILVACVIGYVLRVVMERFLLA